MRYSVCIIDDDIRASGAEARAMGISDTNLLNPLLFLNCVKDGVFAITRRAHESIHWTGHHRLNRDSEKPV